MVIQNFKEVAIYLRKSRDEELESKEETLARHERILLDYCNRNNLIVKKIFKEVVSGESIENRPRMQQLLEDVSNKKYEGVVVIEIERLSRGNQVDQAEILEVFKKSGAKIYTLNKIYDLSSDDEFDEDFFEFGLFMSRREYKVIKRRLIRGKKQAQKEGYFTGSHCPFGYTKKRIDRGFVLIPDDNAKIVKLIYHKFIEENYNITELRQYLNENGIKFNGKTDTWNYHRLRNLIQNKVYIGFINVDTLTKEKKWLKGRHEALIDNYTFDMAQEKLKDKSSKVKKNKVLQNPLASLIKCGICGKAMVRTTHKNKKPAMSCSAWGECSNVMSNAEDVEKKVILELQEALNNYTYFIDNYGEEIEKKRNQFENEKKILEKEIAKKEKMIEKCCEMLEEEIYTKEKYLERVNILENDLKNLRKSLTKLKPVKDDEKIIKAIPILENVLKEYWNLSVEGKNEILKSIISKIEYVKTTRNDNTKNRGDGLNLINLKIHLKI